MFIGATLPINREVKLHPDSRDSDGNQYTLKFVSMKLRDMK